MPTPNDSTVSNYLFDNANEDAERQVELLAAILDVHTELVLYDLDIDTRWQCLDLGSGGGSVPTMLGRPLFAVEHVVAIDQDPRYIEQREGLEIRQADVMTADLGENVFDLIHARLLFMHLPEREQLLRRAIAALKPGGLIVVSDWDCTHLDEMLLTGDDELREAFLAFQHGLITLGERRGMDPAWARRIPAVFAAQGLTDLGALVYNKLWYGGQPGMQLHACNSRQLQEPLLDAGVTKRQLDVLRAGMEDPQVIGYTYPMYTAVGRRPR
ncbi:methyltransferase domain-containing protein [Actinoplanes sp. NPDC051411]|uniref:class I SAM-dependent methyltransferase n=1 Tax=Actinoplanes sp. NPDC051411 TaxID=3155522 RepID=UPI003428F1B6